jgi:hypothetical protein
VHKTGLYALSSSSCFFIEERREGDVQEDVGCRVNGLNGSMLMVKVTLVIGSSMITTTKSLCTNCLQQVRHWILYSTPRARSVIRKSISKYVLVVSYECIRVHKI